MRRHFSLFALSLLGLFALPSGAQDPDLPPQGMLYLGQGKILEAARPRQMTLNANVVGFLYQPGGLSIAYMGVSVDGDMATQTVRLVGLKRGESTTLTTDTMHFRGDSDHRELEPHALSGLAGWSGDGRYLLIEQTPITPSTLDGGVSSPDKAFLCVDVGASPIHLNIVPLPSIAPPSLGTPEFEGVHWQYWWSPGRARLLFAAHGAAREGDSEPPRMKEAVVSAVVYDPARQQISPLPLALPTDGILSGWLDEGHVVMNRRTAGKTRWFAYDTATGAEKPLPGPPPTLEGDHWAPSPKDARLMLDVEARFHPDRLGVTGLDSHLIWVRRAGGQKKMSALPIGLTPNKDDPQAQWSPTGQQVAFVSHGDLFVTDLSVRDASPREKLAAGDKLSCPEEQLLAQNSLRQIGLGFMQYTQDWDEQFPPAADVNNRVLPYIKDKALFTLGDSRFVYAAPPNLGLASMEAPAQTVIGTLDTPCARNVLYADGHVQSFPKAAQQAP